MHARSRRPDGALDAFFAGEETLIVLELPDFESVGFVARLAAPLVDIDPPVLVTRLLAGPTVAGPFSRAELPMIVHALRGFGLRVSST